MFYKNEACTQQFIGNDKLYEDTPIYCKYNMLDNDDDYETQIGTISGTITLTDIPTPVPRVTISGYGSVGSYDTHFRYGAQRLTISSSGMQTISWSIPIYGNGFFADDSARFSLDVDSGNGRFDVVIPTAPHINSANASGINLGTVSIKSITLSGTITITMNGQPVPYIYIAAVDKENWDWIGSTELTSPAAGASWSITLSAATNATNVTFEVRGYQSRNSGNTLFYKELENPQVTVSGTSVSGINLNVGDVKTITLSGTINVTYNWQMVPHVNITSHSGNVYASTDLTSPAANASWSITMEAKSSPQEVSFWVSGYNNNWDDLFQENVTPSSPSSPIQVYNTNISGIVLNLGNITP